MGVFRPLLDDAGERLERVEAAGGAVAIDLGVRVAADGAAAAALEETR